MYGEARSPCTELMFTTRPQPRSYMCGSAPRTSRNGVSSISRRMQPEPVDRELVHRRDVLQPGVVHQHVDVDVQRVDRVEVGQVDPDRGPADRLGDRRPPARSRSTTTTCAPSAASRSAQARPMPDAPPVTIARRPASVAVMPGRLGPPGTG